MQVAVAAVRAKQSGDARSRIEVTDRGLLSCG
jgi:hypothetical protein